MLGGIKQSCKTVSTQPWGTIHSFVGCFCCCFGGFFGGFFFWFWGSVFRFFSCLLLVFLFWVILGGEVSQDSLLCFIMSNFLKSSRGKKFIPWHKVPIQQPSNPHYVVQKISAFLYLFSSAFTKCVFINLIVCLNLNLIIFSLSVSWSIFIVISIIVSAKWQVKRYIQLLVLSWVCTVRES